MNTPAPTALQRLRLRCSTLWGAWRRWRHERRLARGVQRHLSEMSESQLRDIGLSRGDIPRVAASPGWSRLIADMNAWARAMAGFGVDTREQRP